MRLPYLQVTQETWDHARSLSALTGVDVGRAFMAVCDLWRWALRLGPEDQPPTGTCTSPRAEKLLAAGLGWSEAPTGLVESLVDIGLVERLPDGLRVRGMGRYKRTWEKNHRTPARTVPVSGTNPAPPTPKTAPQTQTQTQTQTQIETQIENDVEAAAPPPEFVEPPRIANPEHPALKFFCRAQDTRTKAGLPREKPPKRIEKLNAWYSEALSETRGDEERLWEAWLRYGDDKYWEQRAYPFEGFMSQWGRYAAA